jgi:hypothetical protein
MTILYVPKGDKGYNKNFTIKNFDGSAFDLTGYTITLKYWKPGNPGTLLLSGACVIDVAASGTCHYALADGNFASVGKFEAEIELTKTGIVKSTRVFDLEVTESG